MALSKSRFLAFGVAFALSGCSFASDALFPSLGGDEPAQTMSIPAAQSEYSSDPTVGPPPALGSTNFEPGKVTPGQPTGTFVGQKVNTFRNELRQLQESIRQRNNTLQTIRNQTIQDSQGYHETVAVINARLQVGTTPGNPVLHQRWAYAQNQLEAINTDISAMNQLATQVASDSAMAAYLMDSIRAAYGLSGAVEEDHLQLRVLEDEANQTTVLIERLLSELSQDIARQQTYVANERGNLNTLALGIKNGQLYGSSLGNQAAVRTSAAMPMGTLPAANIAGQRPLVVIRFDRPNVAYEQALYQAVSRAIERRPNASFDLVAVSAPGNNAGERALGVAASRRNAEQVLRSLTEMGLPADRIRMSGMASPTATSNEVHLYVR
ncbi:MAG: hypothetical protein VR70_02715 [Rhodospirillaceae bacterium BRH_c57]|nr:MAG: hypothetical protein VR70_02715 [Rhodospirillaceae bacterium BRH_c57]